MSFLIISPNRDPEVWIKALKEYDPELEVESYPNVKDPEAVEFVLSWKHPHGVFQQYPNLKVLASSEILSVNQDCPSIFSSSVYYYIV